VLQSIARGEPLRQTLELLARGIEGCTTGLKASVLLVEGRRLRFGAGPSLPDEYNRAADGVPVGEGFGSCGTAAHRRKQVIVSDIQSDSLWKNYREIARRYGLGACWSTPILDAAGEALGTFALYYGEPRQPEAEELRLVGDFAQLAGIAIERQRTIEALRQSERNFGSLVDDLDAIVWEAEVETHRFTYVSQHAETVLGYPVERWLAEPDFWSQIIHDEDREATVRHRQQSARELRDHQCEYRVRALDGRIVWLREMVHARRDPQGQNSRLRGVMLDISRQREAEQSREELLRRLEQEQMLTRAVIQQMPEGVIVIAARSARILAANQQAERILGFPIKVAEKLSSYGWWQGFHLDGRPYETQEWPLVRALEGETVNDEMSFVRGDGTPGTMAVSAGPVHGIDGRVLASVVVFSDISERKRAESAQGFLADASARLVDSLDAEATAAGLASRAALEFADWCLIVGRAEDGSVERLAFAHRDPAKADLAVELDRLRSQPGGLPLRLAQVLADGGAQLFAEISPAAFDPGAAQTELVRLLRELGTTSAITVAMKARSRVVGAISFGSSSAERRYGASELAVAEELGRRAALALENARLYHEGQAALRRREQFLAIAAHELKTPLTSLKLRLQTLLIELDKPGPDRQVTHDRASAAERQTKRLARLVDELLDVSSIHADRMRLERQDLDLVKVLQSVVARFQEETASRHIDMAVHATAPVLGKWDRVRIEQVITNLVSNAIKYGEGRPVRITVETDDGTARLTVEDEGMGMSAEVLARIFRPFERGVAAGQYGGLGLGLYITDQIVRAHGGTMRVRSAPGQGSSFIVELPRGEEP
jgi:PAS domain S-box-containing protein